MDQNHNFRIEVQDQVVESEINALSPLQMKIVQVSPGASQFLVCTDQSGLMGVIRYLHNHGFVFLSIIREQKAI